MSESVINLTRGVPPTDVFPVEDLIACGHAALRRGAAQLLWTTTIFSDCWAHLPWKL